MKRLLHKSRFSAFLSVLICFCCVIFYQNLCSGDKTGEAKMQAPQEGGSAWDLPAGVYDVEETDRERSENDTGGSPTATTGSETGDSSDMGGSPYATPVSGDSQSSGYGGSPSATPVSGASQPSNYAGSPSVTIKR